VVDTILQLEEEGLAYRFREGEEEGKEKYYEWRRLTAGWMD
jgi:hypothetical protein